ncbi:glycosyltransferase [bacterium]|nr:MAG: glycosyltransferase [bacterium]
MTVQKQLKALEIGTTDIKGGAATVSWNLKNRLSQLGYDVSMIVGYKRSHDPKVREIFYNSFEFRIRRKLAYLFSNDISLMPGKRIINWPEFQAADIIHAHNLHSNFFNLKALPEISNLKPFVWTLHDMWPLTGHPAHAFDCPHWIGGEKCTCDLPNSLPKHLWNNTRHLWQIKNDAYRNSRLNLVVPSLWLKQKVEKSMLRGHPLHLIYNGVDTEIFKPGSKPAIRQKLGLPMNKKIVLFSSKNGLNNIWKGGNYVEKLVKTVPRDAYFIILGGNSREKGHFPNTKYINYIADEKTLAEFYAASDIFLYPSIADNCPLSVLEAMACGLPILAFATGGIPELVEHRVNGYVANYKDETDLANGFKELINLDEEKLNELGSSSRKKAVEKFSAEQMVENYLKLYFKLIEQWQ